jgi:hypothetical protein
VLQDALALLPDDVETVSLRSDSAGYQIELLKYCAEGKNARFGVIEFTVSADVNAEFRRAALAADAVWKPLCDAAGRPSEYEQEYAEVAFVPSWIGNRRKDAPEYRFLAIREPLRQLDLPHIKAPTLPCPTQEFGNAGRNKLFSGVVTNRLTTPAAATSAIYQVNALKRAIYTGRVAVHQARRDDEMKALPHGSSCSQITASSPERLERRA